MPEVQTPIQKAPSIKHQTISKRYYFDVALGSVCLTGANTGGAYCLLEVSLAPGIGVPRHIHTREDETYYVTSGELEVIVGEEVFVLKAGDTLMAPRDIPHELRNSGNITNHYLLIFSPSGFEEFVMATALLHGTMLLLQPNGSFTLRTLRSPFRMSSDLPRTMELSSVIGR